MSGHSTIIKLNNCSTIKLFRRSSSEKKDDMKVITENKEKNENKNVCNCDVVHNNIVDTVKSKMPDENMLSDLSDFLRS